MQTEQEPSLKSTSHVSTTCDNVLSPKERETPNATLGSDFFCPFFFWHMKFKIL